MYLYPYLALYIYIHIFIMYYIYNIRTWVGMRSVVSARLLHPALPATNQESKNSSYWMVPSMFTSILANLRQLSAPWYPWWAPRITTCPSCSEVIASYKQHEGSNGKSLANGTLLSWPWRCFGVFHEMEVLLGESWENFGKSIESPYRWRLFMRKSTTV